jgi:hypothetical protein
MNKIKLILFLSSICLSYLQAQDYKTVQSDRIAYFNNYGGDIKCVRIDSGSYPTDSIYYFSHNIQEIGPGCFMPYGFSWIGRKAVIKKDYNLFFNRDNDTICIKTNSLLNEKWKVFSIADSLYIYGQVVKLDTMSFLGLKDSVKTISFAVYDKSMKPVSMYLLDTVTIIISKNYGFVKTLNFLLFPNCKTFVYPQVLDVYTIAGLSKPKVGVQNLTWLDVNDYNVNDEVHVYYEAANWEAGNNYSILEKTIYKYFNRIDYKDSVKYYIDREQSTFRRIVKWDSTSFAYVHDTIFSVFKPDSIFDKYPDEPIVQPIENRQMLFSNLMSNAKYISKTTSSVNGTYMSSYSDSCWQPILFGGCLSIFTYIKGLGGPYYTCIHQIAIGGEDRKLVYYKKGDTVWGTPLVITGFENIDIKSTIEVFPNPADDLLWIRANIKDLPYSIEIMDLKGRILLKAKIVSDLQSINICGIAKGLYVYKIISDSKMVQTGKIIKK